MATTGRPDRRSRERRVRSAVTLTDIASHAGVSLATASRVLNGSARTPAEDIAQRVRQAAHELGYVANAQAQALARAATGLVGLVVHDIADPYFSSITRGAQRYAGTHRSQVLLAAAERSQSAELEAVGAFVSYRTDAIILAGSRRAHSDEELAGELGRYIAHGGRVVTLGPSTIPGARFLEIRHREAAAKLVSALLERGVGRYVILAGPPEMNTARQRVEGYLDTLRAAGNEPLAVVHGGFNRDGGYASAIEAWRNPDVAGSAERVCLLAVNDVMALGAIAGLRSLGVSVPEDAQVAGFDDIPTLLDIRPTLTTVRLPMEEIGARAAELALAVDPDGIAAIEGEPVIRESAG